MGFRNWYSSVDQGALRASIRDKLERGTESMFAARDDIRHKLVEEAWYGRQTTGNVPLRGQSLNAPHSNPIYGTHSTPGGTVWDREAEY